MKYTIIFLLLPFLGLSQDVHRFNTVTEVLPGDDDVCELETTISVFPENIVVNGSLFTIIDSADGSIGGNYVAVTDKGEFVFLYDEGVLVKVIHNNGSKVIYWNQNIKRT